MYEPTKKVLTEVYAERERQDEKWGGPDHDDRLSIFQFIQLIRDYASWARVMFGMDSTDKCRNRLVQVAALAVAAVEKIDRASEAEGGAS